MVEVQDLASNGLSDIVEAPIVDNRPSIRERFRAAATKEVVLDYFLYSCFEYEKAKGENAFLPRYPQRPAAGTDWDESLRNMLQYYKGAYPALGKATLMNHELMEDLLPAFVTMAKDFREIVQSATSEPVPQFKSNAGAVQMPFWGKAHAMIVAEFPNHGKFLQRYLEWTHGFFEEEKYEPGSRPPVGKYAPSYRERHGTAPPPRGGSGGPGRGGDRGPPRGGDRGPPRGGGGDRGPRGGGYQGGPGGDRGPRGDSSREDAREPSRDAGPQGGGRGRDGGGQDGPRGPRHDRPRGGDNAGPGRDRPDRDRPEKSEKLEAEAFKEVSDGIQFLKDNPGQREFALKPANSYYRRLQHQTAVEQGFNSRSAGEGNDRTVVISKTDK